MVMAPSYLERRPGVSYRDREKPVGPEIEGLEKGLQATSILCVVRLCAVTDRRVAAWDRRPGEGCLGCVLDPLALRCRQSQS